KSHTSEATSPLLFELRLPSGTQGLGRPEAVTADAAKDSVRARTTLAAYALAHRKGGNYGYDEAILDLKQNDQVIASISREAWEGYGHWAYTFTPDARSIITGGANGVLSSYDLMGKRLGDFIGHEGVIWALAPSPDGRLLVSSSDDQTVRLWNV